MSVGLHFRRIDHRGRHGLDYRLFRDHFLDGRVGGGEDTLELRVVQRPVSAGLDVNVGHLKLVLREGTGIVDHDLDEIAAAFIKWGRTNKIRFCEDL